MNCNYVSLCPIFSHFHGNTAAKCYLKCFKTIIITEVICYLTRTYEKDLVPGTNRAYFSHIRSCTTNLKWNFFLLTSLRQVKFCRHAVCSQRLCSKQHSMLYPDLQQTEKYIDPRVLCHHMGCRNKETLHECAYMSSGLQD